jgi:hypothetical protein
MKRIRQYFQRRKLLRQALKQWSQALYEQAYPAPQPPPAPRIVYPDADRHDKQLEKLMIELVEAVNQTSPYTKADLDRMKMDIIKRKSGLG